MIGDGDRIAVGVSGMDSLCLLWILRERLNWIPIKYEIKPVYIDLGFDKKMGLAIEKYLQKECYDYEIIQTDIGVQAHGPVNRENPCFFCSWKRKKKFFSFARDIHCNKIALGHHLEDINATLFINILYGGSMNTMLPHQNFFNGRLSIIRPLALVYKEQIKQLADFLGIPPIVNPCPSSKKSQRKEVNNLLDYFYRKDQRIRYNIFWSLKNIHRDYLPR